MNTKITATTLLKELLAAYPEFKPHREELEHFLQAFLEHKPSQTLDEHFRTQLREEILHYADQLKIKHTARTSLWGRLGYFVGGIAFASLVAVPLWQHTEMPETDSLEQTQEFSKKSFRETDSVPTFMNMEAEDQIQFASGAGRNYANFALEEDGGTITTDDITEPMMIREAIAPEAEIYTGIFWTGNPDSFETALTGLTDVLPALDASEIYLRTFALRVRLDEEWYNLFVDAERGELSLHRERDIWDDSCQEGTLSDTDHQRLISTARTHLQKWNPDLQYINPNIQLWRNDDCIPSLIPVQFDTQQNNNPLLDQWGQPIRAEVTLQRDQGGIESLRMPFGGAFEEE